MKLQHVKREGILSRAFLTDLIRHFGVTTFVETGTYMGGTTRVAADLFEEVHTIELGTDLYERACRLFAKDPNVTVYHGDSAQRLPDVLGRVRGTVLFWLDAHYSEGVTARGDENTPILREISLIARQMPDDAVLLVDDLRFFMNRSAAANPSSSLHGYPNLHRIVEALGGLGEDYRLAVFGDVGLVYRASSGVEMSPLVEACTVSRRAEDAASEISIERVLEAEQVVAAAEGAERTALLDVYRPTVSTETLGLGGYYRLWRGLALAGAGDVQGALPELAKAISLGRTHWRVYGYLAKAAERAGRSALAAGALDRAVQLAPDAEVWRLREAPDLSARASARASAGASTGAAPAPPACVVVVFSKDRALQLDATLRSYLRHAEDAGAVEVRVLYAASNDRHARQYAELAASLADHGPIRFVRERHFREDLASLVADARHVLFLVDDNVFTRPFRVGTLAEHLDRHPDALGYSLRLGRNTTYCYPKDQPMALPVDLAEVEPGTLAYRWTDTDLDFEYPLEVSSSLYRRSDLAPLLADGSFRNPNELEGHLAARRGRYARSHPRLLCAPTSLTFCAPVNKVQQVAPNNRAGTRADYGAEHLADLFEAGVRLDVPRYDGFVPNACHQEVELHFAEPSEAPSEAPSGADSAEPSRATDRPPVVTVVIPCYNQAHVLPEAVASVIGQTFSNWDLVIVNDGSTDDTASVAEGLAARYEGHLIRVIHQENAGPSVARNAGVAAGRGRYILPLDADDVLLPEMLARTVEVLDAEPDVSIVYTDREEFGALERTVRLGPYDFRKLCAVNLLSYCSLYRREAWEAAGGYNPNMVEGYEDWDFWIGCGECGHHARHLPVPLFRYRLQQRSRTSRAHRNDAVLRARIVLNHPRWYTSETVVRARAVLGQAGLLDDAQVYAEAVRHFRQHVRDEAWEPADALAERLAQLFPEQSYPWVLRSMGRRMRGDAAGALQAVQQALGIEETPFALFELVQVALASEQDDEAHEAAELIRSRHPGWADSVAALLPDASTPAPVSSRCA